jgi:separase
MALKTAPADASLVDSVKEAVKSATSCTPSTVSSLQSLLRCTKPVVEKGRPNNKTTKLSNATTASATGTVTRTKSTRQIAAKVAVYQSSDDVKSDDELSVQERLVLATEVFNAASKALSDVLASQKSPLKPLSPNQIVSTPTKSKTNKTVRDSSAEGVVSVSECASLALANLRTLKNDKTGANAYPNIQLEQGACVVAGRLISLGLNKLAFRELKGLKKRLQEFLQSKPTNSSKKAIPRSVGDAQREAPGTEQLTELLVFKNIGNAGPVLNVLVPFQSTVLKLVISEAKISTVEQICSVLTLSNSSSPANIILRSLEAGNLKEDKAALQLLSLSNSISSLSSLMQKSNGTNTSSAKRNAHSLSTLTLQLSSMEVRLIAWELSGHNIEQKREFWDPLLRSLEAFSKSGLKIQRSDFVTIYTTVQRLKSKMKKDNVEKRATPWRISLALGRIAQDASCLEDALKLFSNAIDSAEVEQPLAINVIQCRVAFIHLCLCRNMQGYSLDVVSKSISAAAAGLKSSNKGSAHDLEELVVESAKLKKLAMANVGEFISSNSKSNDDVIGSTVGFLHAFIRFLRRYIGRQALDEDGDKSQSQAMLCRMKTIILAAVDSAVALGKTSVLRQVPHWEHLQPILSDSRRLLGNLENLDDDSLDDETSWSTAIVKLSNVYWSRYLKEKEAGQGYKELIPLLDQSASLLQTCPPAQRAAGFAALKFERLGHLYLEARMGAKSVACLERSTQEHIDSGVLQQHMEYLTGKPPLNPHDSQSPGFILGRVLSSYLKVQVRRPENDQICVFDNKALSPEERGILFEWQMAILAESHSHEADTAPFREIFQTLVSEILCLYSAEHYPVRRLRVTRFVLRFILDHPNSVENVVTESLIRDAELNMYSHSTLEEDVELEPFLPHIQNSLTLAVSFHKGEPELDELRDIIASWASTMRKCRNPESFGSAVDDCDHWIAQVKALSDYLDARGYWKLYLATSEIILHVLELQPILDESSILMTLSRCALQYCRRGDCKTSIELLDRAQKYIDSHRVSIYASVSYHLARSEYYLEIGDADNSEQALASAQQLYQSRGSEIETSGSRSQSKIGWERLVVDGTLLFSRIAYHRQNLETALYYAKLSVRLSMRLWAKLERLSDRKRESDQLATKETSEMDLVIDRVANLDIGTVTTPYNFAEGAVYWGHVASHNACFLNLMRLSAHNGLFQDAIYYGEQALKVNKALGASFRLITCQAELGLEWIRGNHLSEAKEVLQAAMELSENLVNSIEMVKLKISLAALSRGEGEHDKALRLLQDASTLLDRVSEVKLDSSLLIMPLTTSLEGKMANLKIRQASVQKESELLKTRRSQRTKTPSKSALKEELDTVASRTSVYSQSIINLKNEIVRQQIHNLLAIQDLDEASRLLEAARASPFPTASQISIQIEEVEHIVADAMKNIATHAVYCVLPESTLSVPSIEAVIEAMKSPATKRTAPVKRSKSTAKQPRGRNAKTVNEEADIAKIMSHAKIAISETVKSAVASGSTIEGHAASCLMGRISMLLHATTPGLVDKDILTPVNANGK